MTNRADGSLEGKECRGITVGDVDVLGMASCDGDREIMQASNASATAQRTVSVSVDLEIPQRKVRVRPVL